MSHFSRPEHAFAFLVYDPVTEQIIIERATSAYCYSLPHADTSPADSDPFKAAATLFNPLGLRVERTEEIFSSVTSPKADLVTTVFALATLPSHGRVGEPLMITSLQDALEEAPQSHFDDITRAAVYWLAFRKAKAQILGNLR